MPRRKASAISVFFAPPQRKRLPFQGSWRAAPERLLQIYSCRRLRQPYLFSRKRKDRGEKSAWLRLVLPASDFR